MSFKINRVYTRSGDKGETGLVGGKRVPKTSLRVHCYGEVDELNSVLGIVKEELSSKTNALAEVIEYLQQELFDLGAELATPPDAEYEGMWKASAVHVTNLEKLCDAYGDGLPELSSFILPGGSKLAAALHLARTVARRAERSVCELREQESLNPQALCYLNRLSDLLFILARWALRAEGKEAPLWVKFSERKLPLPK